MEERISKLEGEIRELRKMMLGSHDTLTEKLGSLEKSMYKFEGDSTKLFGFTMMSSSILADIAFIASVAISAPEKVDLEGFEDFVERIKEYINHAQGTPLEAGVIEVAKTFIGISLGAYAIARKPFAQLAPVLVEKLDKDLAKKVVPLEVVLKYYGSEATSTWKSLVES